MNLEKRKKVAQIITNARKEKNLTQADLADLIGMKRGTINKIECSIYSPNADVLYLIMEKLDCAIIIDGQEI